MKKTGSGFIPDPVFLRALALRAVKHIQHEADTLAQSDEANHHRKNDRKQTDNLIENAGQHIGRDDARKLCGGVSRAIVSEASAAHHARHHGRHDGGAVLLRKALDLCEKVGEELFHVVFLLVL